MVPPRFGPLAVVPSGVVFLVAVLACAMAASGGETPVAAYASSIDAAPGVSLRTAGLAQAETTYRGGLV
ncbi:MAG: hypothetical protein ABI783_03885, partial [Actinomycetota bacterium]